MTTVQSSIAIKNWDTQELLRGLTVIYPYEPELAKGGSIELAAMHLVITKGKTVNRLFLTLF